MNKQAESPVIAAAMKAEAEAVGANRAHESAHLHVAGEATYIDRSEEHTSELQSQ